MSVAEDGGPETVSCELRLHNNTFVCVARVNTDLTNELLARLEGMGAYRLSKNEHYSDYEFAVDETNLFTAVAATIAILETDGTSTHKIYVYATSNPPDTDPFIIIEDAPGSASLIVQIGDVQHLNAYYSRLKDSPFCRYVNLPEDGDVRLMLSDAGMQDRVKAFLTFAELYEEVRAGA